jgi:hypothetical protein
LLAAAIAVQTLKSFNPFYCYKYEWNITGSCMIALYVIEQAGDHVLSKGERTETKKAENQFRNACGFVMLIVFSLSILKLISVALLNLIQ